MILTVVLLVAASHGAVLHVPSVQYPTVSNAYAAAVDGDVIEVEAGLRLELPPLALLAGKRVSIEPVGGLVILAPNVKPPNDEPSGSLPLDGLLASVTDYNYTATHSSSEPDLRFARNPATAGRTMWWSWVAPRNGLVVMTALSPEISVTLDVYSPGNPPTALALGELDSWLTNQVSFHAAANAQYFIAVSAEEAAPGVVTLTITMPDPPANDNFATPTLLEGDTVRASAYTYAASAERPTEPSHAGVAAGYSVWFQWTAPLNGVDPRAPVTLTTAGSDFDTALAVYRGNNLATLLPVVANDDTTNAASVSRFSTVTFVPTPGETYRIAVDGSLNRVFTGVRNVYGNVRLRLDYTAVNLSLAPGSLARTELPGAGVRFIAALRVDNYATVTVEPLRLRLVALPGFTKDEIQRVPVQTASNLGVVALSPATLAPGQQASASLQITSPPPVFDSIHGLWQTWGISALLEERLGADWLPVDTLFLGYGFLRPENDDGGLGTGALRPPTLTTNLEENIRVYFALVQGTNILTDSGSWDFLAVAVCSDGTNRWVTNAIWTLPPGMSMSADGILTIGPMDRTTTNVITARFTFNRSVYANSLTNVIVYRRPRLSRLVEPAHDTLALQLLGETGRRYVIERAATVTEKGWTPLTPTNTFQSQPIIVREQIPPSGNQFYRARMVP